MGALPKKKISSSRRGKRYATKKITLNQLVKCDNCGNLKKNHTVCQNCGQYKGKQVLEKKEEVKVTKVSEENKP